MALNDRDACRRIIAYKHHPQLGLHILLTIFDSLFLLLYNEVFS